MLIRNIRHDASFVETDLEKKQLHEYAFDDMFGLLQFLQENESSFDKDED